MTWKWIVDSSCSACSPQVTWTWCIIRVSVKRNSPWEEDRWEDKLSEHQVRGWRAVPAEGLRGECLRKRRVVHRHRHYWSCDLVRHTMPRHEKRCAHHIRYVQVSMNSKRNKQRHCSLNLTMTFGFSTRIIPPPLNLEPKWHGGHSAQGLRSCRVTALPKQPYVTPNNTLSRACAAM